MVCASFVEKHVDRFCDVMKCESLASELRLTAVGEEGLNHSTAVEVSRFERNEPLLISPVNNTQADCWDGVEFSMHHSSLNTTVPYTARLVF